MEVSAQHVRLEVDLGEESFRGSAEITVSTQSSRVWLHCRQLEVLRVEVDGGATTWELWDPLSESRTGLDRHDVAGLETWLRASMCASAQGELAVDLPQAVEEKDEALAKTYRVTIAYRLRRGQASTGVRFFGEGTRKGARTAYRLLGSALASMDFDGVRCWMPCLDVEPSRHAWRLDLAVVGPGEILASGRRAVVEADGFFRADAHRAAFVVDSAPARAVGFVVLGDGHDRVDCGGGSDDRDAGRCRKPALSRLDSTGSVPGSISRAESGGFFGRADSSGSRLEVAPRYPEGLAADAAACWYGRDELAASAAAEVAAKLAEAVQFWRSWFATDGRRGEHKVVLSENLEVPFVPCVGLTIIDSTVAKLSTSRYDSLTVEAQSATVATAVFSSLALEDLAVRDADADEWVLHALVGAVASRFVDGPTHHGLRRRVARLAEEAVAAEAEATRRPLSLVGEDDPPSWWRAAKGAPGLCAKATLVAHALEARLGRSTVRRAAGRLLELCRKRFLLSTNRFLRACALEIRAARRGLQQFDDDLEAPDDQISISADESLADFRARWVEGAGCAVLDCDYSYNPGKRLVELHVEQRIDDPRSFETAANLQLRVRVVERDDARDYCKSLDALFHKWEFKAHIPEPLEGRAASPADDLPQHQHADDLTVEAVASRARAAAVGPVLYVRLDPDLRLLRRVVVRQPEHAWVEQLLGDDDLHAQLDAIAALSPDDPRDRDESATDASVADRMLAARALAAVLRGVDHPIAVRCAAVHALAAWQRRQADSRFAAAQLWRAFDERFKLSNGLIRPGAFRGPGAAEQLALKTALAAAFGRLAQPGDATPWPDAADRCLELLRDHVSDDDDDDDHRALSNELYLATALESLALVAAKGDDAWLDLAIVQARRYLDWYLRSDDDRDGRVAAAALAALRDLLQERDKRLPPPSDEDDIRPPRSADELLCAYRGRRVPEAVRAVALRAERADPQTRDQLWDALASTADVAFDQPRRLRLLDLYYALPDDAPTEKVVDALLPDPLLPLFARVQRDHKKRRAPKRQRYVRDLDVKNPDVLKKIKINFTAAAPAPDQRGPTPPPGPPNHARSPVPFGEHLPTNHHLGAAGGAATPPPLSSTPPIRPVAIRQTKPMLLPLVQDF